MSYDKILLKGMQFYGTHGVLEEENRLGQKFTVNMVLYVSTKEAGLTDELNKSVSYADVYEDVKEIVETHEYKLIEALAENISMRVLGKYDLIKGLKLTIEKPEAPVRGIFDYFGVEIERFKDA
jgi:dihydroneopterin aldolase